MGRSEESHASDADDSIDSLLRAVAAAPSRLPPESGAFAALAVPGGTIGRYRLIRELGHGGMGAVWEAVHVVTQKRMALKIVRSGLPLSARLKQRFAREAELVTAVPHAGVVPVHDVFDAPDGGPVLVMELLHGRTLGAFLSEKRRTLTEVCEVLADVVAIVVAAHRVGIVHRDLKPENVFLCDAASPGPRVRVLDFGIARLLDSEGVHETLTDTGTLLGTPPYMAPEQLFGETEVDHRADVWALGVMLYEAVIGERPIRGHNLGQIVRNLSEAGVPRPDPRLFSTALARAIRTMLRVPRAERSVDLGELETTLRRIARCELSPGFHPVRRVVSVLRGAPRTSLGLVGAAAIIAFAGSPRLHTPSPEAGLDAKSGHEARPVRSAPRASHELAIATLLGKTTLHGRALDAFRQALAQRTGERLVLNVRWAGAAGFRGSERALVSGLRTEQFDGAALGSKALPLVRPSVAATNLPGVVDSWTKVDALRDELRDQLGAGFEHEGLRRLAWLDEGCERVMTRGQPVRRAADLAHRRVAMSDTDPFAPILYSLVPGSVPVALESSGIGDALGDGSRLGVSVVVATAGDAERFQWTHHLDHVTLMPLSCASGALVLRKAVHERLDPELRAVVDDLSARLENESGPLARHADTAASLRLGRSLAHVDLTPAERRDWRRLFVDTARHSTPALLPGGLVDKAILLGREIDALD